MSSYFPPNSECPIQVHYVEGHFNFDNCPSSFGDGKRAKVPPPGEPYPSIALPFAVNAVAIIRIDKKLMFFGTACYST